MAEVMGQGASKARTTRPRSPEPEEFERNVRRKLDFRNGQGARRNGDAGFVDATSQSDLKQKQTSQEKQSAESTKPIQKPSAATKNPSMTNDAQLALAHLLHDAPDHALYQRNLDHVLDALLCRADLATTLCQPFEDLITSVAMTSHPDSMKTADVRTKLTQGLLQKILHHVGDIMGLTGDEYVQIEEERPRHRLHLKISPIFELADDDSEKVHGIGGGTENKFANQDEKANGNVFEDQKWSGRSDGDEDKVDSGTECEVQRTSGNPGESTSHHTHTQPFDLKIVRHPCTAPGMARILLRDPRLRENKPLSELRELAQKLIDEATSKLQPSNGATRCSLSIYEHAPGSWVALFPHVAEMSYFVNKTVTAGGRDVLLEPFSQKDPQVFICSSMASGIDMARALRDLLTIMPGRQLYVMQGYSSRQQRCMVVILDGTTDVKRFEFSMKKTSGKMWPAKFVACGLTGSDCHVCGEDHFTQHCAKLSPLQLGRRRPGGLLRSRPWTVW